MLQKKLILQVVYWKDEDRSSYIIICSWWIYYGMGMKNEKLC